MKSHPGPRTEEFLSYLAGLAPIGQTFELCQKDMCADMGWQRKQTFYFHLNRLLALRAVRRVACGNRGSGGVLQVLRRPEEIAWDYSHLWRQPRLIG